MVNAALIHPTHPKSINVLLMLFLWLFCQQVGSESPIKADDNLERESGRRDDFSKKIHAMTSQIRAIKQWAGERLLLTVFLFLAQRRKIPTKTLNNIVKIRWRDADTWDETHSFHQGAAHSGGHGFASNGQEG
ncbi:MAG: hypothetical protein ACK587_13250, partial [Cyanobacteriota bacterium]